MADREAEDRDESRRVSALIDGEVGESPAKQPDSPAARRALREQSHIDTLLRGEAGQLRPPADLVRRVGRSIRHRQATRVGLLAGGMAAVLCIGVLIGWFAHRPPAGIVTADAGQGTVGGSLGPEAGTACNVLRVDPAARTVTIVICRAPDGGSASTEVRTFALASDCRILVDGKSADLGAMSAGQPIVGYVVKESLGVDRLASLDVRQ